MDRSRSSFRIGASRMAALLAVFFFAALAVMDHQPAVASRRAGRSLAPSSRVMENFARLPLAFEANRGQVKGDTDFLARGAGFEAFLDRAGATLVVGAPSILTHPSKSAVARTKPAPVQLSQIRMSLGGASGDSRPQAKDRLPGVVNYYRGSNPAQWHREVPTYRRVKYAEVYRGIDLAYYGDRGSFEFDFDLKPHADANQIALTFDGIEGAGVSADSGALLKTAKGDLTLKRPVAYQEIDGVRRAIDAQYKFARAATSSKSARITIALGDYDHSRPLTIDPVLLFSTLFGGTTTEINGAAIDSGGNVYVTGFAFDCSECVPFPTTTGQAFAGDTDAFVSEISADGSRLVYSTLIGGNNFDQGKSIAVDGTGNAYVTGVTFSTNFPETVGPASAPGNGDGFVAKFGTTGAVTWATYLGGSEFDEPFSIALAQGCASNCSAYVAGLTESSNFPGASGFTGANDAFVTEMNANGSLPPVYTKLIAGNFGPTGAPNSGVTYATSLAVDGTGIVFVAGGTDATDFPKTVGSPLSGATDAFVAKLNAGSAVAYARLLGGSDFDQAEGIAIPPNCTEPCNAYLEGVTFSSNFPTTMGAAQTTLTSSAAEFVTELSGDGSSTIYSTLLGTSDAPLFGIVNGIAVDTAGDAYVIGSTTSAMFSLNHQVESFPGPNGSLFQFQEGPPGPSPTPAPTELTWAEGNGSPLTIQEESNATFIGTTTGIFVSTDGVDFSRVAASRLPSGAVTGLDYENELTPNVIFAGTASGLYISTDLGATFTSTGFVKATQVIVDLAGSSLSNTDVLAGTVGNGLWSSTNGGASFTQVASIPATATVFALTSNAKNPPFQVFAGTSRGVYTASNFSGSNFPDTWSATNLTMSAVGALTSDRNSTPVVDYAGTFFQGLYESTDNFTTFLRANVPQFSYSSLELDRDNSTSPATVFAGVNAIEEGFVYQNASGYGGAFTDTNYANLPGNVKGLKSPYVGDLLQDHPVVAELNPAGSQFTFSSYLAGSSYDEAGGIAVDPAGANIYVAGSTFSTDFPIAGTQLATNHGFVNGFIAKMGPSAAATSSSSPTPTPTATPTGSMSATPTATPTAMGSETVTPTATPTPNGSKLKAPTSISFKPVGIGIGASSTAKLVIQNTSKVGNLIGNIGNPSDPEFTFSASNSFSLPPKKSITITITMMPTGTAPTGTIAITSNGGNATVTLKGTGLPGKLSVPKSLTITSTGVGIAVQANLILKNVGKGLLTGSSMPATPNPPFSGGGEGGGGGIPPGKTAITVITFTPQNTSEAMGSIELVATPPNTGSTTVTLKGIVKVKK